MPRLIGGRGNHLFRPTPDQQRLASMAGAAFEARALTFNKVDYRKSVVDVPRAIRAAWRRGTRWPRPHQLAIRLGSVERDWLINVPLPVLPSVFERYIIQRSGNYLFVQFCRQVSLFELGKHGAVVSQFEISSVSRFLYGPRTAGTGFAASINATTSVTFMTRSIKPAAIAGVAPSVLWTRQKL
ncbi:hypothetical protein ABIB68_004826 [Bradyrhizobium sp. F1.2.2]